MLRVAGNRLCLSPKLGSTPLQRDPALQHARRQATSTAIRVECQAAQPAPLIGGATGLSSGSSNAVGLEDFLGKDGGPPRFSSPFVVPSEPELSVPKEELPLLVFLPGIDGMGVNCYNQFPALLEKFDVRTFSIPVIDRTPFNGIVDNVVNYLSDELKQSSEDRPVYLMGESFGGTLALAVALRCPKSVHRLVLVNPATAFPQSVWPQFGPLLTSMPRFLYEQLLPFVVAPLCANPLLLATTAVDRNADLPMQALQLQNTLVGMLPTLPNLAKILPPETLAWKLKLLDEGAREVNPKLHKVMQRTLVVAGTADGLLNSEEEAKRLSGRLIRCATHLAPGRSHAMLMEDLFSISDIIEEEGFYTTRRRLSAATMPRAPKGTISDPMEIPTPIEAQKASEGGLDTLNRLSSPVFFSTREADGQVVVGLDELPEARPIIFVGNHQTFATDLGPLVAGVLKEKGMLLRGLAHPVVFSGPPADEGEENATDPGGLLSSYGAVPVSARNMYNLLNNGEAVLLYPGGVREAYKRRGEEYNLIWPKKPEVIRMAARFGATIVPLSAIGIDDNVEMIADTEELLKMPFVGDYLRDSSSKMPNARTFNATSEIDETFVIPFGLPKGLPDRYYFLFGKPIQTDPSMVKNSEQCEEAYQQLKSGVEDGIAYLCKKRNDDPYRDLMKRLIYEGSWGGKKKAPTFVP